MFLFNAVLYVLLVFPCALVECHVVERRAVISERDHLWPSRSVSYVFDDSVSNRLANTIRKAMNTWEDNSCLKFVERTAEKDYVRFISKPNEEDCTCDSVGRRGSQQDIILGYSCQSEGELLHTLGHILGYWHEQSRPDRYRYVQVFNNNIEPGQEKNFRKREDLTVGYEGVGYNFKSIMHLGSTSHSKNGMPTTGVLNAAEYQLQGNPKLGQRLVLAEGDILRTKHLYHCPGKGLPGILRVEINRAERLTILEDPQVEITAVDTTGTPVVIITEKIRSDRNPTWNAMYEFPIQDPKQWQFFRIQIVGGGKLLSMPLTIMVEPGEHSGIVHCINANDDCARRLIFGYTFLLDGDECSPNPCMNGGTCIDGFVDFTCACTEFWGGEFCERDESGDSCDPNPCIRSSNCIDGFNDFICDCLPGIVGERCNFCDPNFCKKGHKCLLTPSTLTCNCKSQFSPPTCASFKPGLRLEVRALSAKNLQDADGVFAGNSDPYVSLQAFGQTQNTTTKSGTQNPIWDRETFSFGCQSNIDEKSTFRFKVYDDDAFLTGGDDPLSNYMDVNYGSRTEFPYTDQVALSGYSGFLKFDVHLISDC